MKVYTRQGDQGETLIPAIGRTQKHNEYVTAVGDIDELNAWIGMLYSKYNVLPEELQEIQKKLFDIGAQISHNSQYKELINNKDVKVLEELIDKVQEDLPPLKNFILPTYPPEAHIARAVCRRAERSVNALANIHVGSTRQVIPYLNRLSDFLFVYSRYVATSNAPFTEVKWTR